MKHLIIYFLLITGNLLAQQRIVYDKPGSLLLVEGSRIGVLEDKTGKLSAAEALVSPGFKSVEQKVPNLGVSTSSFWLKFEVENTTQNDLLINLAYPNLDMVDLYLVTSTGTSRKSMGKYLPFSERKYNSPSYIFDLDIKQGQQVTVLIRIQSAGQVMAPLYLGDKEAVFETVRSENLFVGIYSGVILIMFFYNLFIYFTIRDKVYLYYVAYILVVGLVQVCLLGYTFQFLWPGSPWLAHHSVNLLSPISCIGIIEFIKVFLRTKELTPRLHKGFHVFTFVYSAYILIDLFNLGDSAYNIIQFFAMLLSLYILIVAYKVMNLKYRPGKFLFFAWVIFLIGVFVYALKDVGVLPYNNVTVLTMPIGSAIETALLSFALADRINILKMEKEESQAKSLSLLRENERIITEQKDLLEIKVKERTAELEETREQLVNAEKMASLGQLTAGISHEINNPINFVVSNIQPLKKDIEEILQVLEKYGELTVNSNISEKITEVEKLKKLLDVDFLVTEINLLLKGIDEGAMRTAEIVKGLKNFSRVQDVALQSCNIHEGIDSTLAILNNAITSANIKVVKHYDNLPMVNCFPGKINQVFMNILNNAVQAVGERKLKNEPGMITITTALKGSEVEIRFKDNGIGISKVNQGKVFEPFFTTKEVGAGTGLGLSIVYGIINSHNGSIRVVSEENTGAEFIITLPVSQDGKA